MSSTDWGGISRDRAQNTRGISIVRTSIDDSVIPAGLGRELERKCSMRLDDMEHIV